MQSKFLQMLNGVFVVVIISPAKDDEPRVLDHLDLTLVSEEVLGVNIDAQNVIGQSVSHGHRYTLTPRIAVRRVLGRNPNRQKHHGIFILLQSDHGADVGMKGREDYFPVTAVLQHDLEDDVQVEVEVEGVIKFKSAVLK